VILDLTVPGAMGGKDTLARLLEIDPQVKAIVSSGYSDDPIMADFLKYGFRGVLAKPYQVSELSKILHDVIMGKP
jgi:DNA-binding NarL/FixJ family response regulator